MLESVLLLAGGLAAGVIGGMLGIGGGVVLMPLLRFGVGLAPAFAAGTCITAVFFTTLGGSYRHHRLGTIRWRSLAPVIAAGALATVAFSLLFTVAAHHDRWLDLGIGLVFLMVSARMIDTGVGGLIGRAPELASGNDVEGPVSAKLAVGAAAGALPGLLGIGTGALLVPAFTFLFRAPVKIAMAASLACFCINALISASFKVAQGFVDPAVTIPVCVGTLIGANVGAWINKRSRSDVMKLAFGLLFVAVSFKFLWTFARSGA
jgi:hypothetical protein